MWIWGRNTLIHMYSATPLIINREQPSWPAFKFYVSTSPVSPAGGEFSFARSCTISTDMKQNCMLQHQDVTKPDIFCTPPHFRSVNWKPETGHDDNLFLSIGPRQESRLRQFSRECSRMQLFACFWTEVFKINSQSLEDTQVGCTLQKYTLAKYILEKYMYIFLKSIDASIHLRSIKASIRDKKMFQSILCFETRTRNRNDFSRPSNYIRQILLNWLLEHLPGIYFT